MKKLFILLIVFMISSTISLAADMRFIQADSVKYSGNEDSVQTLRNLVNSINQQKNINFVIFTGNNIVHPDKILLKQFLKQVKAIKAPVYIVLGNKDVNRKKELPKTEYMNIVRKKLPSMRNAAKPYYYFEKNKVIFIVMDGSKDVIPTSNGYYREDTLTWLDEQLTRNAKRNVVIFQHFPIVPPAPKDAYNTYKADEYLKILNSHKNVKAVISGFGMNSENDMNGIKYITTKDAPAYRVVDLIECESDNPVIWSTLRD